MVDVGFRLPTYSVLGTWYKMAYLEAQRYRISRRILSLQPPSDIQHPASSPSSLTLAPQPWDNHRSGPVRFQVD